GATVPNYKRVVSGAQFLIDTRLNGGKAIVGRGVIGEVRELPQGEKGREFEASYSSYEPISPPMVVTPDLEAAIRSVPRYNVQHAIRPLTRAVFTRLESVPDAWG